MRFGRRGGGVEDRDARRRGWGWKVRFVRWWGRGMKGRGEDLTLGKYPWRELERWDRMGYLVDDLYRPAPVGGVGNGVESGTVIGVFLFGL